MGKNDVMLEGVRMIFRNFSGEKSRYNREGARNFCAVLSPEQADHLIELGWRVKELKPRPEAEEEGIPPQPYIKVNVNLDGPRQPKIVLVSGGTGRQHPVRGPENVSMLDWAEVIETDIVIAPYIWEDGEPPAAYLQTMYLTIEDNPLDLKYANRDD